jgi:hypothetical protein
MLVFDNFWNHFRARALPQAGRHDTTHFIFMPCRASSLKAGARSAQHGLLARDTLRTPVALQHCAQRTWFLISLHPMHWIMWKN